MGINKNTPFYLITFSILLLLVLPFLLQDGMFMDGLQYACVSKNLADGNGTFWFPVLSNSWNMQSSPYFMEHPPLFYGIESVFFKVLGSSMYTERIFSFCMLLLSALFIHLIWQMLSHYFEQNKSMSWFPVLIWIITPVCFWAFQNHMIETLLSVLTLASVFFSLKALLTKKYTILYLILSGSLVMLAFLTKGFPGLFPLVTIPLFYFTTKKINSFRAFLCAGIVIITPVVIYFLLVCIEPKAKENLDFYITQRLIHRIHTTSTVNYRAFIMLNLIMEFLPSILLCLIICFFSRKQKTFNGVKKEDKQLFLFMLFLGLSASAPLMSTMVQKSFYLVPSIPFFALSLSFLNADFFSKMQTHVLSSGKRSKILSITSVILLLCVLVFSFAQTGKASRDKDLINEVETIGSYIKNEKIVGSDNESYYSWSFQFYMLRKYGVQLNPKQKFKKYFISTTVPESNPHFQYKKVDLPTTEYKLYVLK